MSKKIPSFLLFVGFLISFLGIYDVNAVSRSVELLIEEDQEVIVDKKINGSSVKAIGNSNYYSANVSDIKDSQIENIQLNPILKYRQNLVVNDPFEPQSYLDLLGADAFWDISVDASSKVIALIDGGLSLNHEDLVNRWAINGGEFGPTEQEGVTPNCTSRGLTLDKNCNNIDDDGNGYVDDWRGWDFAWSDNDPMVGTTNPNALGVNHATLVAGLIGATGDNSIGVASLNWQSKILPLQIFTDDGAASTLELAEAISYAIDMDVDVINLSLGSTEVDPTIESLLETAYDNGIVVVAAVGNCSGPFYVDNGCLSEGQMLYPSFSEYVIAVGASDLDDNWADFSGRGVELDILAPGSGDIITTDYSSINPTSIYSDDVYGSSYAAPIVSGLVAQIMSVWPDATFDELRSVIVDSTVKPSGMLGRVFTSYYGFGRLNPLEAVNRALSCRDVSLGSDINCDGLVNLLDLSLLSSQWLVYNTGRTDVNQSGLVDLLDLSLIASRWGQ